MLSSTSHIRVQVEQTRIDLLKWIGKRWIGIRQEGGFDELEGWALKEISDSTYMYIYILIFSLFPSQTLKYPLKTSSPPLHALRLSLTTPSRGQVRFSVLKKQRAMQIASACIPQCASAFSVATFLPPHLRRKFGVYLPLPVPHLLAAPSNLCLAQMVPAVYPPHLPAVRAMRPVTQKIIKMMKKN